MSILKVLCILLSIAVPQAFAQDTKPYHGTTLTVTRTTVNARNLRLIYARNSERKFILTCNAGERTCKAPYLGYEYQLVDDRFFDVYECDEYKMIHESGHWARVCMDTVRSVDEADE